MDISVSVCLLWLKRFLYEMSCKWIERPIFDTFSCVHRNARIALGYIKTWAGMECNMSILAHRKVAKRGCMTISNVYFYQGKVTPHKFHQSWSIIYLKT